MSIRSNDPETKRNQYYFSDYFQLLYKYISAAQNCIVIHDYIDHGKYLKTMGMDVNDHIAPYYEHYFRYLEEIVISNPTLSM